MDGDNLSPDETAIAKNVNELFHYSQREQGEGGKVDKFFKGERRYRLMSEQGSRN